MTDTTPIWLPAAIAALSAVLVAIIGYLTTRNQKKQTEMIKTIEQDAADDRKRIEYRAEVRQEESQISMEMMNASCNLGLATSKAVKGEKINGDMEKAQQKVVDAMGKYEAFTNRTISKLVSG